MFENRLWLDIKYASLVSGSLGVYKVRTTHPFVANFRCPLCGDSKKHKFKARAYLFEGTGALVFTCHNCGKALSFENLLSHTNQLLYSEYKIELIKNRPERLHTAVEQRPNSKASLTDPVAELKKIGDLDENHAAAKYLRERQIPVKYWSILYYAPLYFEWVNKFLINKINNSKEERRIIIPFIDRGGTVFGCQGRAIDKSELRYITTMFGEAHTKVFGLDRANFAKRVYIFEGPFDSLFIDNSLAMAGADVNISDIVVGDNFSVVLDNEPRSKEIVRRMEAHIQKGHNICIWPKNIYEKDINDMVNKGYSSAYIQDIIDNNTFQGLEAKLRLSSWRRD